MSDSEESAGVPNPISPLKSVLTVGIEVRTLGVRTPFLTNGAELCRLLTQGS